MRAPDHNYSVILAGGKGERLWPLSRNKRPKQFLPFGGKKSLLEHTLKRISPVITKQNTWVVTTTQHQDDIDQLLGKNIGNIIAEPVGRNTGPAILYTCFQLVQVDPEAVVTFVPADQVIGKEAEFRKKLTQAMKFSQEHEVICLLGIKPTYPASGYGYIEYKAGQDKAAPCKVSRFHEKPSKKTAQLYVSLETMLWNAGIFCGPVSVFIKEFQQRAPRIFEQVTACMNGTLGYEKIASVSIDHAVLERAENIYVLPVDFMWSDVGDLNTFLSLAQKKDKTKDTVLELESEDNIVQVPNKLVALIGVEDLCVVETDDVLLIARRGKTDKVKLMLELLRKAQKEHYL